MEKNEQETINFSTFQAMPEMELTNQSEVSMDWHSLPDQKILQGYGDQNPVHLEQNYYKTFVKEEIELKEVKDEKTLCTLSCIQQLCMLLSGCSDCNQPRHISKHSFSGAVLILEFQCKNNHRMKWSSSKMINNIYSLNLQLIAAVIMSGNLFEKFCLFSPIMGIVK